MRASDRASAPPRFLRSGPRLGLGWTVLALAATLAAAGCCKKSDPTDSPSLSGDSPKTAGAQGAPPGAKYMGPGNVPDVPETRSNPPTVDEWKNAAEVNTVGANSAPSGCSMHIVREWLKVNCSGKIEGVSDMEGFGKKGFDYFDWVQAPSVADFVVRLRRGNSLKLRINREKDRASLFANWPSGQPKPSIIALQAGPKG